MKRYFRKWENAKNQISEINNNKKARPRSVTCNHYNNVIVTVSNNNLETDSNFKPKIGLKSGMRIPYVKMASVPGSLTLQIQNCGQQFT